MNSETYFIVILKDFMFPAGFSRCSLRPICLSVKSVFTAFLTQKHAREYEKERRMVKRKKTTKESQKKNRPE